MANSSRNIRAIFCATTALWGLNVYVAHAQSATNAPIEMNLGSVVATGQGGAGYIAPSSTGTLGQAQQEKKLAPNVVSIQPQSQIQKLPDVNVAEALQRVPGVSLETDSGAGRYVNIRGLDADLNGTTYDGLTLPATNTASVSGGARATAFDVFPSGIIGGDEVVKSLTPDIPASGLGGEVNLLSPSLPDNGLPTLQISGGSGVESLRTTPVYDGSITYGQHFAIPGLDNFANAKPFSFIGTYAAHGDQRGIDDVEESYNSATAGSQPASLQNLQLRHYQEHRDVMGASGEFDFDPSPQTNIFIRGIHTGYNEFNDKNRLEIDGLDGSGTDAGGNPGVLTYNGGSNFTATGATASKQYTDTNERIALDLIEFGGHTVIGDLVSVDAHTSWAQGSDIFTRGYGTVFTDPNPLTVTYDTSSPSHRTASALNENTGTAENLADPNNYTYTGISNTPSRAFDQIFENAADASIPTSYFHYDGELKAGVDILLREKTVNTAEYDGTPNDPNIPLSAVTGGNKDQIYYNHYYNVGPDVNNDSVLGLPTTYTVNGPAALASFQHDSENIYAGYVQQTINIGALSALLGVRVESTDGAYGANAATTTPQLDGQGNPVLDSSGNPVTVTTYSPNVNHQHYTNVFPSVQLKYNITPDFQVRAAFSTAIARPGFEQVTGATTVDYQASTVSKGNPALKPTTGNSLDLTAEYYTIHDGLLSANLFYKSFSNYIAQTSQNVLIQNPSATTPQAAILTSYENIGGAVAEGIELDAHQKFYFLPAPFDGLGADGNFTYVNATAQVHQGLKKSILPQTSPITYNAALFYEKGPISLRVAAAYVARNLFAVGGDPSTDVFSQPRFRVDIGGTYEITPRLSFYADAKNLTNTKLEFTQSASTAYPIQREFYGQDYLFGFRYRIN